MRQLTENPNLEYRWKSIALREKTTPTVYDTDSTTTLKPRPCFFSPIHPPLFVPPIASHDPFLPRSGTKRRIGNASNGRRIPSSPTGVVDPSCEECSPLKKNWPREKGTKKALDVLRWA